MFFSTAKIEVIKAKGRYNRSCITVSEEQADEIKSFLGPIISAGNDVVITTESEVGSEEVAKIKAVIDQNYPLQAMVKRKQVDGKFTEVHIHRVSPTPAVKWVEAVKQVAKVIENNAPATKGRIASSLPGVPRAQVYAVIDLMYRDGAVAFESNVPNAKYIPTRDTDSAFFKGIDAVGADAYMSGNGHPSLASLATPAEAEENARASVSADDAEAGKPETKTPGKGKSKKLT